MDQAIANQSVIASYVSVLIAEYDLAPRAMRIAWETGQKATYDSYYLALAEYYGYELWTADTRYWQAVHVAYPFVKWLGGEPFAAEPVPDQ